MKYAVINGLQYDLNDYYTETGRLHLFINNQKKYNLETLESNIELTDAILIFEDEELIGKFSGYKILQQMEKRYGATDPQIYIYIDSEKINLTLENLNMAISALDTRLENLSLIVDKLLPKEEENIEE